MEDKKVVVYMEFINYLGEVIDKTQIAEFKNYAWAKPFIKYAERECGSTNVRIRWEEK